MPNLPARWQPSAWHMGRASHAIEYSLRLPAGITATVRRRSPFGQWQFWIGIRAWDAKGPFRTAAEAVTACETALRAELRRVMRGGLRG